MGNTVDKETRKWIHEHQQNGGLTAGQQANGFVCTPTMGNTHLKGDVLEVIPTQLRNQTNKEVTVGYFVNSTQNVDYDTLKAAVDCGLGKIVKVPAGGSLDNVLTLANDASDADDAECKKMAKNVYNVLVECKADTDCDLYSYLAVLDGDKIDSYQEYVATHHGGKDTVIKVSGHKYGVNQVLTGKDGQIHICSMFPEQSGNRRYYLIVGISLAVLLVLIVLILAAVV